MKSPWYFMPFIAVYKTVFFILTLPFYILKYFYLGLCYVSKIFYKYITMFVKIVGVCLYSGIKGLSVLLVYFIQALEGFIQFVIKYIFKGFGVLFTCFIYMIECFKFLLITLLKWIYQLYIYTKDGIILTFIFFWKYLKYFIKGIYVIIYLIGKFIYTIVSYMGVSILAVYAIFHSVLNQIKLKRKWYHFNKKRNDEYAKIVKRRKKQEREVRAKEREALEEQRALFAKSIRDAKQLQKSAKKKKTKELKAMVIDFAGEDAVKSEKKQLYEYVAKNPEGKVIKDYFEAFSKVEVHSFLASEGYEIYSIKTSPWITFLHGQRSTNKTKIRKKHLIFFITQLSTYLKAGITLAEALKILTRQQKKASYKKIFSAVMYDLTMGVAFSDALQKQGNAFPQLLINMVKTAEMTGELPEALDDMSDYYTETERTRKQMITALMYPTMVLVFAIAVITFILIWVIPQFVEIYESMDASKIPAFTLFILGVSNFLKNYLIWLLLGIVILIGIFIMLYRKIASFRKGVQWLFMHIPVLGNVVIYNEVTMFTKTFASLLKHNVFITDSMEILTKITNNEIYKFLIMQTIDNIAHGEKISKSFEQHWAFPIPAYEMLVTGEKTGQLPDMMAKVSSYYQEQHAQQVTRIKTFIEPILIIFLTVIVGIIILAIIIPMFGMYDLIE